MDCGGGLFIVIALIVTICGVVARVYTYNKKDENKNPPPSSNTGGNGISEYERRRRERDMQEKQEALKAKLKAERERRIAAEVAKTAQEELDEDDDMDEEEFEDDEELEEDDIDESGEEETEESDDTDGEEPDEEEHDYVNQVELEAQIELENLRILQGNGSMETGRVTEVEELSENYCYVNFKAQTFDGTITRYAIAKKDEKYAADTSHYILLDKEDEERCVIL